jgi:hypothetical protein
MKLPELNILKANENWLLDFIIKEFKKEDENITPLKILAKLGVGFHDQTGQLNQRAFLIKFRLLLKRLHGQGLLTLKDGSHDSLGIKEHSYKLK